VFFDLLEKDFNTLGKEIMGFGWLFLKNIGASPPA